MTVLIYIGYLLTLNLVVFAGWNVGLAPILSIPELSFVTAIPLTLLLYWLKPVEKMPEKTAFRLRLDGFEPIQIKLLADIIENMVVVTLLGIYYFVFM